MPPQELTRFVAEAVRTLRRQADRITGALELHTPYEMQGEQVCAECVKPWPCPTARRLNPDEGGTGQ